jgi:hypothetical protein
MDDVLVNFDAERARQTLRVFAEVADHVQIIFLTCHQHTMDLVSEVLPKSKPIVLPGGSAAAGTIVAARASKHSSTSTVA